MSNPEQRNLNQFLTNVLNFIDISDAKYKETKAIFESVFKQITEQMGKQCNYFKSYGKGVLYAGSVYDSIKITKLDEFDMDIVIRLPVDYNKIIIEDHSPGYVRLKVEELKHLQNRTDWESRHKVTRLWRDDENYLLQNQFRFWMQGIIQRALNDLNNQVIVKDVTYNLEYSESGPAYTLKIRNIEDKEFKLDVDLVPVIRFQHPRWPPGHYRIMTETYDWLVVPKPNKALPDGEEKNRCWRLSFQDYERNMMKACFQLKPTIKLVKKLRDAHKMKAIASYYIKTLFLWKIDETKDKKYWQKGLSVTFRIMVGELYNAVQKKSIPYFWNEKNNLLANVKQNVLNSYADELRRVIVNIDYNYVDRVASYFLNDDELKVFRNSAFYERQPRAGPLVSISSLRVVSKCGNVWNTVEKTVSSSKNNNNTNNLLFEDNPSISTINNKDSEVGAIGILKSLDVKMDMIHQNLENQNERLNHLELAFGVKRDGLNNNPDKVESLSERLSDLEKVLKFKEKSKDDTAVIENLQIEQNNATWSEQYAECSTSKDENDTVLAKLDGYNERLKRLEESAKNNDSFDEVEVAGTEVPQQVDDKTTENDNEESRRYKIYLSCDRPDGPGSSNPLKMLIDPFGLWYRRF